MISAVQERAAQLAKLIKEDSWLASDEQPRVTRSKRAQELHEREVQRNREEQQRWSEALRRREAADAAYVAGIIGEDPEVAQLAASLVTAESELGRVQAVLTDIRNQQAKLTGKVSMDLGEIPLEQLAEGVRRRQEQNTIALQALATAEQEAVRRLGEAEAQVNELQAAHKRAQRICLHHHCDQLIAAACPQFTALHSALVEIWRVQGLINDRGGQRQGFASLRLFEMLEHFVERMDRDVADIARYSEEYERR